MKKHAVPLVLAGVLALAATGLISSPAWAGPADTWGYTSTATDSDGAPDLSGSGWTAVGSASEGTVLGSLSLTRNDINYTIQVSVPASWGYPLLMANIIANTTADQTWSYSYLLGDGATSAVRYIDSSTSGEYLDLDPSNVTYYTKSNGTDDFAAAATSTTTLDDGTEVTCTEIVDVTSDGRIVHNLTFTNPGDAPIPGVGFSALLDTMLNGDDNIPIIANGTNSAYIDNGTFRLYLGLLQGDQMLAGSFWDRDDLSGYVPVNNYAAGATVVQSMDTAVAYNLQPADLAAHSSVRLAFVEQLLATAETVTQNATVTYVDDDNNGATVGTPTAVSGMPGDQIITEAAARAGVPAGYQFVSMDPSSPTYDMDASTTQTVTVHVSHQVQTTTPTTTRTIHFTGAGDTTPADVVQTAQWTCNTDQVTQAVSCTTADPYAAVTSPTVEGYTVDPASVPAGATTSNALPADSAVTVTYTAIPPTTTPPATTEPPSTTPPSTTPPSTQSPTPTPTTSQTQAPVILAGPNTGATVNAGGGALAPGAASGIALMIVAALGIGFAIVRTRKVGMAS